MKDINRVVLTGEVVSDAVFSCTPRGTQVTTFNLAFLSQLSDGGKQRGTIEVVCIGDVAMGCRGIVIRSQRVRIEGSLQQRSWKTPEGLHKSKTEIVAQAVELFEVGTTQEAG